MLLVRGVEGYSHTQNHEHHHGCSHANRNVMSMSSNMRAVHLSWSLEGVEAESSSQLTAPTSGLIERGWHGRSSRLACVVANYTIRTTPAYLYRPYQCSLSGPARNGSSNTSNLNRTFTCILSRCRHDHHSSAGRGPGAAARGCLGRCQTADGHDAPLLGDSRKAHGCAQMQVGWFPASGGGMRQ